MFYRVSQLSWNLGCKVSISKLNSVMALKTSFSTMSLPDIVVQGGFKVKSVSLSNYQSPSYIITSGLSVQRWAARLDGLIPRVAFLTFPHPMGPVRPLNMSETVLKLEQIGCDCFFSYKWSWERQQGERNPWEEVKNCKEKLIWINMNGRKWSIEKPRIKNEEMKCKMAFQRNSQTTIFPSLLPTQILLPPSFLEYQHWNQRQSERQTLAHC